MSTDFKALRQAMVTQQLMNRGITNSIVLAAMQKVPRENFVPDTERHAAYEDRPLPIGAGQTISQPYIVAYMIEALQLKGSEKVLEVGAGSGYAAAVLAEIAIDVFSIERIAELAAQASANLRNAGYPGVKIRHADGTQGWPKAAPFDAILVSAGAPAKPHMLIKQLAIGGRLVVPIGDHPDKQRLIRITRTTDTTFAEEWLAHVRFVPLIGTDAWEDGNTPHLATI